MEHDRCLRCNRVLKQPQARVDGMGKICKSKAAIEKMKEEVKLKRESK